MTVITRLIVVFSAALGLLALTETVGDAAFNFENHFSGAPYGAVRVPSRVEVRRASDGTPTLMHGGLLGSDEHDAQGSPPFTCAQMQVIDEVELISEETPNADCD
jgi:hypothetical protein